jgi:hypothetical protein
MSGSLKPAQSKQEEGSLMNLFNWSCPMLMTMHSSFLTVRCVVGDESVLDGAYMSTHTTVELASSARSSPQRLCPAAR